MSGIRNDALSVGVADVEAAAARIGRFVLDTPLLYSPNLSRLSGARIWLKLENMHATGAFKERGALNKLLSLSKAERARGVITMSAGNHAQALAFHASRLSIPATIVMPRTTPFVKVGNTEALGAEVRLAKGDFDDARAEALTLAAQTGKVMVPPFDDPLVIAGQGTMALEILRVLADVDCLVVPVGGGGLISGIAVAVKAANPKIEVIGVQVASYGALAAAIGRGPAGSGGLTLADGIAVKGVGDYTLPIVKALVDDIRLVEEAQIEHAVYTLAVSQKTVVEGAGAAGLALVLADPAHFKDRKVAIIISGGNIDPRLLASLTVRGLERDDKIVSLRVTIFDQPGVLGEIATLLGEAGANILSISHRRILLDVPARGSTLDMMIETTDAAHSSRVIKALEDAGYKVSRMSDTTATDLVTR